MKIKNIYIALGLALLFTGCQNDEDYTGESDGKYYPVELLMGMNQLTDGGTFTRALPSGYSAYTPTADPGKIGMFMTQSPSVGTEFTYTTYTGTFTWDTSVSKWTSNVYVKYDDTKPASTRQYYAYGFMPAGGSIAASIKSTDYSSGATMTLKSVPPVSAQDVCIVTGVFAAEPNTPVTDPPTFPAIEDVGIKVGNYAYTAKANTNAIYLLLHHVYSKYELQMKVDTEYDKMRTIKVKDMKLSASAPSVDITVTYEPNVEPVVSMKALSTTSTLESDVFSTETTMTTTATPLTDFYCADMLDYITLKTTFDVYDKHGNKLRSDCKATNTIKVQKLEAGKYYTIVATIKPTYLYQLSEEDLNTPSLVI